MHTKNWTQMLRLALRRDRVLLPALVLGVVAFAAGFVPAMPQIAGTPEEVAVLRDMMTNPAMVAMMGGVYGEVYTIGIMYAQMMLVWCAAGLGVVNILVVVRHTRGDEESGRLELIRSLPVGRAANLTAVTVMVIGLNLAVFLAVGFGMAAFRVDSIDLAGSLAFGAALAGCGLFFGMLALALAQVVETSRGAIGVSLGLLGAAYLARAAGDVGTEVLSLVSPLGLPLRVEPFHSNQYWPVLVLVAASAALFALAAGLSSVRDHGVGMLGSRGGRAHAPASLSSELGLVWRLLRGSLLAWMITLGVLSGAYGSVMGDMESFVASSPIYRAMIGMGGSGSDDASEPIVGMLVTVMSIVAAVPVITAAHKLRAEERRGSLEQVLGKAVPRRRLFACFAGLALGTAVVAQAVVVVSFWGSATASMADPVSIGLLAKVAGNQLAALIGLGGLACFLVGLAPWLIGLTWGYLAASFLVVYMGGILDLPRWAERLTPYGLVQRVPTEEFSIVPWLALVVAGVGLAIAGAEAFRRRDIG